MADHLANSWESSVGSQVEGDPIVALSWLHNGVKLALHVEKVSAPVLRGCWGGAGWLACSSHSRHPALSVCCGPAHLAPVCSSCQ